MSYPMATADDLAETVRQVEALGRRIVAGRADVRDPASLEKVLGGVHPNSAAWTSSAPTRGSAGSSPGTRSACRSGRTPSTPISPEYGTPWSPRFPPDRQRRRLDHRHQLHRGHQGVPVPLPVRGSQARGGGDRPFLATSWPAITSGSTRSTRRRQHPDAHRARGLDPLIELQPDLGGIFQNSLPVNTVEPRDVSEAVLFLASDESRYVTGLEFTIDAGQASDDRGGHGGTPVRRDGTST